MNSTKLTLFNALPIFIICYQYLFYATSNPKKMFNISNWSYNRMEPLVLQALNTWNQLSTKSRFIIGSEIYSFGMPHFIRPLSQMIVTFVICSLNAFLKLFCLIARHKGKIKLNWKYQTFLCLLVLSEVSSSC